MLFKKMDIYILLLCYFDSYNFFILEKQFNYI